VSRDAEQGGAGLIGLALLAVGLILAAMLADVAELTVARTRAAAAADAAALAAAPVTFRGFGANGSPEQEAARFAALNGAELLECRCSVERSWAAREVTVVVAVEVGLHLLGARTLTAAATAEFVPLAIVVGSG
jgi:secretion/DNA translocation related TadE-like protein